MDTRGCWYYCGTRSRKTSRDPLGVFFELAVDTTRDGLDRRRCRREWARRRRRRREAADAQVTLDREMVGRQKEDAVQYGRGWQPGCAVVSCRYTTLNCCRLSIQ